MKVALIPPTAVALAQLGSDTVKAWKFAADQANAAGGVDGHRVQLIVKQTNGTPPVTLQAARPAVRENGAQFIGAVMTGPENAALQQQLPALHALSFNRTANDDMLTGADCSPDAFRVVQASQMDITAIGEALKRLPAKTWTIQAEDYSIGHSAATSFAQAARSIGDKVVMTQFAPLGSGSG